jgi:ribosomal protein S8
MQHSYQLSNFLHQLKIANGKCKSTFTYIPGSKFILRNTRFLYREGLIGGYTVTPYSGFNIKQITVYLRYYDQRRPLISHIRTYASPGHRVFYNVKRIRTLQRRSLSFTLSYYVFSTSMYSKWC